MVTKSSMENWLIYGLITIVCMWFPTVVTIAKAVSNNIMPLAILGGFCVAFSIYGSIKLYGLYFK